MKEPAERTYDRCSSAVDNLKVRKVYSDIFKGIFLNVSLRERGGGERIQYKMRDV